MIQSLAIRDDIPLMELGNVLAKSGYFTDAKDAAQAIVKVLAGREMGFGPIASMTGIYIVKGKPSMGANLIAAAVKRSGRYDYRVKEHTDDVCAIEFYERVDGKREMIGVSTFTIKDARKAQTQNLDKYPRNMLFARAMSNGAKWYCADVFGGPVYTPDELGATVDGETGEVLDGGPKWTDHEDDKAYIEAQTTTPEPQPDAPKETVPLVVTPAKKCTIKATGKWLAMLEEVQKKTAYYNDKDGKVNAYHALGAAAKCGYETVTDDNIEHVKNDLVQYALEQQLDMPAA